jgi:hypothetical protein
VGARLPLALESREAEAGAEDVPQAEMKALPDGKLDSAEEREGLSDADAQADGRPEGESDTVRERLAVGVAKPDAVPTEVRKAEGDCDAQNEGSGVIEEEGLPRGLAEGDPLRDGDRDAEALEELREVCEGGGLDVTETQPEREEEGEAVGRADTDTDGEAAVEREDVADDFNEAEGRNVSVSECVVEEVGVEQGEEVKEYDASGVREDVADDEAGRVGCVEVKVAEPQPDREKDGEAVGRADTDTDGEAGEREDVADNEAGGLGGCVEVTVAERQREGVWDSVAANEVEGRSVSVSECVVEEVGVEQGEEVGEYDASAVMDALLEEVSVIDADIEVVGDSVADPVVERQSEGEGEWETIGVGVVGAVADSQRVAMEPEALSVGVRVCVASAV